MAARAQCCMCSSMAAAGALNPSPRRVARCCCVICCQQEAYGQADKVLWGRKLKVYKVRGCTQAANPGHAGASLGCKEARSLIAAAQGAA
jgi:hypothetical protein